MDRMALVQLNIPTDMRTFRHREVTVWPGLSCVAPGSPSFQATMLKTGICDLSVREYAMVLAALLMRLISTVAPMMRRRFSSKRHSWPRFNLRGRRRRIRVVANIMGE